MTVTVVVIVPDGFMFTLFCDFEDTGCWQGFCSRVFFVQAIFIFDFVTVAFICVYGCRKCFIVIVLRIEYVAMTLTYYFIFICINTQKAKTRKKR